MTTWNKSRWMKAASMVVLAGVLLVTSVVVADEDKGRSEGSLTQILNKLDQILVVIKRGSGGPGNPTLRWDQALPAVQRFVVLTAFNNEAVLDRNTGLVWERSPQTTTHTWTFGDASFQCISRSVGGQKGWRLPSIPELASLVDPSLTYPGPTLPPGHPFLTVQSGIYWSETMTADDPTLAWFVGFDDGRVTTAGKGNSLLVWCVRGPMQESVY